MIMEFTITSSQILGFCGLVTALYGIYKIVKEFKKPNEDLKNLVNRHDQLLNTDDKRLKEVESSNKMILQCLYVIINHDITGNCIDKMKEKRDELNEYLINK